MRTHRNQQLYSSMNAVDTGHLRTHIWSLEQLLLLKDHLPPAQRLEELSVAPKLFLQISQNPEFASVTRRSLQTLETGDRRDRRGQTGTDALPPGWVRFCCALMLLPLRRRVRGSAASSCRKHHEALPLQAQIFTIKSFRLPH